MSFSKVKSAVVFALFLCLSFLLVACDPQPRNSVVSEPKIKSKELSRERLTRGIPDPLVLKPYQVQQSSQMGLVSDLYEGLTAYDPQGKVQPALAESWQTEDNKTWFVILRENLKWSNGEPMYAQDFVTSWRALLQSDYPLKRYFALMNWQNAHKILQKKMPVEQLGVEAVDDRILRIQLEKANPALPAMLAHVALLPQYLHSKELSKEQNKDSLVSNGAYRLLELSNGKVVLEKNPFYWAAASVSFKWVEYHQTSSEQTALFDIHWAVKEQNANLYLSQLCTYFYEFNFKQPQLAKRAVRKALSSMISSRNLVRNQHKMTALTQFLPTSLQNSENAPWENVIAEQLLKQNGITESEPLEITLTYDEGELHQNLAENMVRAWGQLDLIRVKTEQLPHQELLARRAKGDFQIIRAGWCGDYHEPSAFLNQFHSANIDNKSGYQNPQFDQWLEQTLSPQSEQQRSVLYGQLEQQIKQDFVVLPIFQYNIPIFIDESIAGYVTSNPTGVIYSKDLYRKVIVN